MNDCTHGAEMCDQCLDIMTDGIKQGRTEMKEFILAGLIDADSVYDFHSNCRLCEAIELIKQWEL